MAKLNSGSLLVARRDAALKARIVESFELRDAAGSFVRAGSALVAHGDQLIAIQDDAFAFACIDPVLRGIQCCGGSTQRLRKPLKPDFEAACVGADGALYVFGSGARENRTRIARMSLQAPYEYRVQQRADLYQALTTALGELPNIEGAVLRGNRLRLLHRGAGGAPSAVLDLGADALQGARPIARQLRRYDLGALDGVALSFTDVAALGDALVYLAVAESTPDAIADGPVAGAAVGILDDGGARWTPLLEPDGAPSRRKPEGIAFTASGSVYVLTDPDDHRRPAELCRLELAGPWA